MKRKSFDRLAACYLLLERFAFGRALERARFLYCARLRDKRRVLLLGDGDGRFLQKLLRDCPRAEVVSIDASEKMLALAAGRLSAAERQRVTFRCEEASTLCLEPASFDAVTTLFFLDCFDEGRLGPLVNKIADLLKPQACWLWADFSLPERGWRRWRARIWLAVLYRFFRSTAGIAAVRLPPAETAIERAGFRCCASQTLEHGLLRSSFYVRGEVRDDNPGRVPQDALRGPPAPRSGSSAKGSNGP